jgi:hypothetical protein
MTMSFIEDAIKIHSQVSFPKDAHACPSRPDMLLLELFAFTKLNSAPKMTHGVNDNAVTDLNIVPLHLRYAEPQCNVGR